MKLMNDRRTTIGRLLCKERNELVVEYSLWGMEPPIGVTAWNTQLMETLPKERKASLSTIGEFEAELGKGKDS